MKCKQTKANANLEIQPFTFELQFYLAQHVEMLLFWQETAQLLLNKLYFCCFSIFFLNLMLELSQTLHI